MNEREKILDKYSARVFKNRKDHIVQFDNAGMPKELLIIIAEDADKEDIIKIIMRNAKTGENGNFGDGRIFVTPVDEAYTISSGKAGL